MPDSPRHIEPSSTELSSVRGTYPFEIVLAESAIASMAAPSMMPSLTTRSPGSADR